MKGFGKFEVRFVRKLEKSLCPIGFHGLMTSSKSNLVFCDLHHFLVKCFSEYIIHACIFKSSLPLSSFHFLSCPTIKFPSNFIFFFTKERKKERKNKEEKESAKWC